MSGVAVAQEGLEDKEYCLQLFYTGQPRSCAIHFVVTWNVEAHLMASVHQRYLTSCTYMYISGGEGRVRETRSCTWFSSACGI